MAATDGKFETLVRIGYFARAVLYVMIGWIALGSAAAIAEGNDGIFRAVQDLPGGIVLLWVLVFGLAAYGIFRLASPIFDIEHEGSDAKGWAIRIGHTGSAIAHFALAWTAFKLASGGSGSSGAGASEAAAGVMSVQFGGAAIGVLGAAFFVGALAQAQKSLSGRFMTRIASDAPEPTRWLGSAGYMARAVVFVVIGWSLIKAGFMSGGAGSIMTLGEAVASLAENGWLFTATAVGLLLFGVFSLILARWSIVPALDTSGRIPAFRA